MQVFLSVNDAAPRVYTQIAVRAGSKHDPPETTGLAHYLEHMMFKGTRRIGSLDWAAEAALLEKIADLYEEHRRESDPVRRGAIYREIDAVSGAAAKLVAANEYDKLISVLGATQTNAYTWVEQTVYINDIPSNEIERWMELEQERFREVTLRLFHTELETVYEEFNISQDRDFRKVSKVMNRLLFPDHPYGTQTTMGEGEHLKNPSHRMIKAYFERYYRPNNMALVMSGDLDPDRVLAWAEQYFGVWEPAPIPAFRFVEQPPPAGVLREDVYGQEASYVQMGWRFPGAGTFAADMLTLIGRMMFNGRAGLMDLGLLQQQRLLDARVGVTVMEDYSSFQLYGRPREGQTLAEVEQLLREPLDRLMDGAFPDWLPEAVIRDLRLATIKADETNAGRVAQMTDAFILGIPWEHYVSRFERWAGFSAAEIAAFGRENFGTGYAVVYKHQGEDSSVMKVDKPPITPVVVNREAVSPYAQAFLSKSAPSLAPVFVDYGREIQTVATRKGIWLDVVRNRGNGTFALHYILEMGRNSHPLLALAVAYLPYLGTRRYAAERLHEAFFRLGLRFGVTVGNERLYVTLSGLETSLAEGMQLFEHVLAEAEGNEPALANLVEDILRQRENDRGNKSAILQDALFHFAKYGPDSPYTNRLTAEALRSVRPEELLAEIHRLVHYEHRVYYHGSYDAARVADLLDRYHQVPDQALPLLPARPFPELPTVEDQVIFLDFPMVQADIMMLSKGSPTFRLQEYILAEWYNEYFGKGLSSIVFQEIRESRALAYAAYAAYTSPEKEAEAHYLRTYVGTQPDKLGEALHSMRDLLENMPVSQPQLRQSVLSVKKKIETGRVQREQLYWNWRQIQRRGYAHDLRKDLYETVDAARPADLLSFQEQFVRGRNYTYVVMGSKDRIDRGLLDSIGPVRAVDIRTIMP
jgi:predicted Zn-dependent peptidase